MIDLPSCMVLTCTVHELSHFIFFKMGGLKIKRMKISIFHIDFRNESFKLSLCGKGILSGYCIAYKPEKPKNLQIIAALISGGLSGIIMAAVILLCLKNTHITLNIYKYCLAFAGFTSGAEALFSKHSTDNILIKKYYTQLKK